MVEKRAGPEVPYPSLRDAIGQYRADGGTRNAIATALSVHISMVARYERGQNMPRPKKLDKLAALIGVSPSALRGEDVVRSGVPGVAMMQLVDVTPDEQVLLEAYRKLPPHGRESLRVHATQLLRKFASPTTTYPFGKHDQ